MRVITALLWSSLFLAGASEAQIVGSRPGGAVTRGAAETNPIPDPPPYDHVVANYAALRALTPTAGQTAQVTDARTGGVFDIVASDPYGNADDSTLVFDLANTTWAVRDFAHTEGDPIQMDWWERLADDVNATEWFSQYVGKSIKGVGTDRLYIKAWSSAASSVERVKVSYIDMQAVDAEFYLLESDQADTLEHFGSDLRRMFHWSIDTDLSSLRVGGPNKYLTFEGQHPGLGTGEYTGGLEGHALFEINRTSTPASVFYWSANIRDSYSQGFEVEGGIEGPLTIQGNRLDSLYIAGDFDNSDTDISGVNRIYYDDVVFQDPFGVNQGWIGPDGDGTCGEGLADGQVSNTNRQSRHRGGGGCVYCYSIAGKSTQKYGNSGFGALVVSKIGYSESSRYEIVDIDAGFIGPRVEEILPGSGCAGQRHARTTGTNTFGKVDAPWTTSTGWPGFSHYLKLTMGPNSYGTGFYSSNAQATVVLPKAFGLEASSVNAGGCCGRTTHMDIEIVASSSHNETYKDNGRWAPELTFLYDRGNCTDSTSYDIIQNNTWRVNDALGDAIGLHRYDTVTGSGTFTNGSVGASSATTTEAGACYLPGIGNQIIGDPLLTFEAGAYINVGANAEITVSKVQLNDGVDIIVSGTSGKLIVPPGAGNGLTDGGTGSQITGSGSAELWCGGTQIVSFPGTPYDFDTDTECEY